MLQDASTLCAANATNSTNATNTSEACGEEVMEVSPEDALGESLHTAVVAVRQRAVVQTPLLENEPSM